MPPVETLVYNRKKSDYANKDIEVESNVKGYLTSENVSVNTDENVNSSASQRHVDSLRVLLEAARVNVNVTLTRKKEKIVGIRVSSDVHKKYIQLDKMKKEIIRAILIELINELEKTDIESNLKQLNVDPQPTLSLTLNLTPQILYQQVHVEKAGVRELREKLEKYKKAVRCVREVLYSNYSNKLQLISKCIEGLNPYKD